MPQALFLDYSLPNTVDASVRAFALNVAKAVSKPIYHGVITVTAEGLAPMVPAATRRVVWQNANQRQTGLQQYFLVELWTSESVGSVPINTGQTITFISGTVFDTILPNGRYRVLSDANGQIVFDIDISVAATRVVTGVVIATVDNGPQMVWTHGDEGWTDFTVENSYYADSVAGDDGNDGLSTSHPKKTLAAAYALLRDGHADGLFLKCGSVFTEGIDWKKSGVSNTARMVVTSYGIGDRPIVRLSATGSAPQRFAVGTAVQFFNVTNTPIAHVAFIDLGLDCPDFDGTGDLAYGFSIAGNVDDVLVEGCSITQFFINFRTQAVDSHRRSNITVRRNIIADAQRPLSIGDHCQNVFIDGTDTCEISENVIDRCGHNSDPTIFRHNVYVHEDNTDIHVWGNIIARGWISVEIRAGAVAEKNLTLDCSDHLFVSAATLSNQRVIRYNVALGSHDITGIQARGVGYTVIGIAPPGAGGFEMYENICSGAGGTIASTGGIIHFSTGGGSSNVLLDANIHDNIGYKWDNSGVADGFSTYGVPTNVTVANNDFQNPGGGKCISIVSPCPGLVLITNRYYSTDTTTCMNGGTFAAWQTGHPGDTSTFGAAVYPDPDRTIVTYLATLGVTGVLDDFITNAKAALRKGALNTDYLAVQVVNYTRAGFGKPPAP